MASSSFFPQEKKGPIIIFAPLKEDAIRSTLISEIEDRMGEGAPGDPFAWLITENGPGKLKIHYATFGQIGSEFKYEDGSLDLIHTKQGWRLIKPLERSEDFQATKENIEKDNVSLMQELAKIPSIKLLPMVHAKLSPLLKFENFQQEHLIRPKSEKASTTYLYCWTEEVGAPRSLLCAGTGNLLVDPVTVVTPKTSDEKKGETYERSYLEKRGYKVHSADNKSASFVENRALRDVIKAVAKGDLPGLEEALNDSFTLHTFDKPVLALSGNSYGQTSINKWLETSKKEPLTNLVISKNDLIPNLALDRFIKEDFPRLQKTLALHGPQKSH